MNDPELDARFSDVATRPVRLIAFDADDVSVVSAVLQDSVLVSSDITYADGQLGLLVNRVRREETGAELERVRAAVVVRHVKSVRSSGFSKKDAALVLSLLQVVVADGELRFIFAGDGEIVVEVEATEIVVRDMARPHGSVSGAVPNHNLN